MSKREPPGTGGLWLAGHRAMREIPRVAAVWKFLTEKLRRGQAPLTLPA